MQCPHCQTENREDRETCYACGKDISTLRLVVNKARQHYNDALEHAERNRTEEAIEELKRALDLDASLVNAYVVLGTLYAQQGKFLDARDCWNRALAINPEMARAHDYLERVESVQAALPTLSVYRWVAVALLLAGVALAASLIYALRPDPGSASLRMANDLLQKREYGDAMEYLERARTLSKQDSPVQFAATALEQSLALDLQQRLRVIQDLKYQQLYPEALAEIADLETAGIDAGTSGALATIRSDISYYYRNMISQLYAAYEQGDVDFPTLETEIQRFTSVYPESPERTEIQQYLERAEAMEVQAAIDELRRVFAMDNNIQSAVEGIHALASRFGESPVVEQARSVFVEEILGYLFNMFTGFLDQEDFVRASDLLAEIEAVSDEFEDMVEGGISGVVDLAYSVLKDARRQHQFKQIDGLLNDMEVAAAEEAIWQLLLEPDLSSAEMGVIRSYWRRINRKDRVARLDELRRSDKRYFSLEIGEEEASETLELYEELKDTRAPRPRRIHLLGVAAASALRLGLDDQATSYAAQLRSLDEDSTVTRAIRQLIRERTEEQLEPQETPKPMEEQEQKREPAVRIEPARPRNSEREN